MFDRGFFLTLQAIRRQLAAMPHDLFLIRLIHYATQKPCPGERLWTTSQLMHGSVVRFLRQRNRQGYDVYIVPYAEKNNSGYILLDLDRAPAQVLARMRANGHEPCLVIQTSAGHLQVWIHLSTTPLPPALATTIAKQLAHTYQADLACTDWRHLGRLAGFTNQKLARRTAAGYAPWVKVLQARAILASSAHDLLQVVSQPLPPISSSAATVPANHASHTAPSPAITTQGAVSIYQHWLQRWHIRERFPQPDWSIVDLWLARQLLAQHTPPAQIKAILRLGSPHFPRQHYDPEDYLCRTLARAALPAARPVSPTHAAAPALPTRARNSDCSNSTGGR